MSRKFKFILPTGQTAITITALSDIDDYKLAYAEAEVQLYKRAVGIMGGIIARLPRDAVRMLSTQSIDVPEVAEITDTEYKQITDDINTARAELAKEHEQRADQIKAVRDKTSVQKKIEENFIAENGREMNAEEKAAIGIVEKGGETV